MLTSLKKLLVPGVVILLGLIAGIAGGLIFFEPPNVSLASSLWAKFKVRGQLRADLIAGPKFFQTGPGVVVAPKEKGMEVRSQFDADKPRSGTDGAVYHFINDPNKVLGGRKKATIAIEVSQYDIYPGEEHKISIQYVQNGRRASGWRSFPVKIGRHIYHFSFEPAPPDDSKKVDSVWIRSDTLGKNRPVTVYSIRSYEE